VKGKKEKVKRLFSCCPLSAFSRDVKEVIIGARMVTRETKSLNCRTCEIGLTLAPVPPDKSGTKTEIL
jgi:hypothetical protein